MVRYGMSHRRKKQKDQEIEDDARMMSSAGVPHCFIRFSRSALTSLCMYMNITRGEITVGEV